MVYHSFVQTNSKMTCVLGNQIKYIVFSVATAVLLYPIILLIMVPVLIYRHVISVLTRNEDPKLGPILTGMDALLAGNDPYEKPLVVLGPYIPFNEKLDRNHIIKVIQEKVINPRIYPNLTQKVVRKYGYNFWRDEDNFKVEDHVRYFDQEDPEKPITLGEFRAWAMENLSKMTFDHNKSPWEWILIPNLIDTDNPSVKSLAMMRINHCLMDGYSEILFSQKISTNPESWTIPGQDFNSSSKHSKSLKQKLVDTLYFCVLVLTGPYHAFVELFFTNDNNEILKTALQKSRESNEMAWRIKEEEPRQVPKERLKALKQFHGVSMTALITTLVAMATGKYLQKRFGHCPKKMYMLSSFPLPDHPDAMCNHWTAVKLPICVYVNDPIRTLKGIHREYEKLRNSPRPMVMFYVSKFIGLLPLCFHPDMENLATQTFVLTNFPGPHTKTADMFGYKYDNVSTSGSPAHGSGFVFATFCMGGMFRFDGAALGTLVTSKEDMYYLVDSTLSILHHLENNDNDISIKED